KKIVFYTIAFIVLFLVFSGFYIKYLDSKLSDISEKREELLKKSKLELSNSQMQKSIEEKTQQYAAIED
ncbi:M23 family peptidase, partial [Campylobacter jejuni]|nr:M23 family peptidase [Campylobacter jejuni]